MIFPENTFFASFLNELIQLEKGPAVHSAKHWGPHGARMGLPRFHRRGLASPHPHRVLRFLAHELFERKEGLVGLATVFFFFWLACPETNCSTCSNLFTKGV